MAAFFSSVWENVLGFLKSYNLIFDTLDILLVAFIIYSLIKLVRDSRAEQLLKGIVLLAVTYFIAYQLDLKTLRFLLQTVFDNSLLLLAIIFQPELRRALEQAGQAGRSRLGLRSIFGGEENEEYVKSGRRQSPPSAPPAKSFSGRRWAL